MTEKEAEALLTKEGEKSWRRFDPPVPFEVKLRHAAIAALMRCQKPD